jgi:hypothetical protein
MLCSAVRSCTTPMLRILYCYSVLKHCALRLLVALKCSYWLSIYCSCSRYVVALHARALAIIVCVSIIRCTHSIIVCVSIIRCTHSIIVCVSIIRCTHSIIVHVPPCLCTRAEALVWRRRDVCGPKGPNDVPMMDLKVHMCGPFL